MRRFRSKIILSLALFIIFLGLFSIEKAFGQSPIEKGALQNWKLYNIRALDFKLPVSFNVPQIHDASTRESATGKIIHYAEETILYQSFGGKESFDIVYLKDQKINNLGKEENSRSIIVDGQPASYIEEHTNKIDQFGNSDNNDWILRSARIQFGKDVYQFDSQTLLSPSELKDSLFDKILSTFRFNQSISKIPSTYTVKKGDTLWDIAGTLYGDNFKWTEISRANKLVNPDLIYPGNIFTIPALN